jgi:hypothetical protein
MGMAGTLTSFVRNGFERVVMLLATGHVDRWDQFIAAPAALATGGLVVFSVWGYSGVPAKGPTDLALFVVVLAIVALFFVMLFWFLAPRYLNLFNGVFSAGSGQCADRVVQRQELLFAVQLIILGSRDSNRLESTR